MKKHIKGWTIILIAVLLVMIIVGVIGYRFLERVREKVILSDAVKQAFMELEARYERSPLPLLVDSLDPEGRYTADAQFSAMGELAGPMTFDMAMKIDGPSHQIFAQGKAETVQQSLDLDLYLDPDFMAVSSQDLVQGNFYGITYDTFAQDIRQIPLLGLLVSDDLLEEWDASVQRIQAKVSQDYTLPQIPEVTPEDLQPLFLSLVAMPCTAEEAAYDREGESVPCTKFVYRVEGKLAAQALSAVTQQAYQEDTAIQASLYLFEKKLVKAEVQCTAGGETAWLKLDIGEQPATGPLSFSGSLQTNRSFHLALISQGTEDHWSIQWSADGETLQRQYAYDWNAESGDMGLLVSGSNQIALHLEKEDAGLSLDTDDVMGLLNWISGVPQEHSGSKTACHMTLTAGEQIPVPEYKNISQWSMEDFFSLLTGIGSMLGIQLK